MHTHSGDNSEALPVWSRERIQRKQGEAGAPSTELVFDSSSQKNVHADSNGTRRKQLVALGTLATLVLCLMASTTYYLSWTVSLRGVAVVEPPHIELRSAVDEKSRRILNDRRNAVRGAMQFVWHNYHEFAWGADEITPVDGQPKNAWGGIGCMILDAMDTLWIMDLKDEFEQAREWVHASLRFDSMGTISFFETTIRALGGLLGAYDLSKDPVFLTKAVELTDRLIPAINATTGRANYYLDTTTNRSHHRGGLAESGTYQLEFEYLTLHTGDPKYHDLARQLYAYLASHPQLQLDGLIANDLYAFDNGGQGADLMFGMAAGADSFYEYLLKIWILTKDQANHPLTATMKQMYLDAVQGMEELLLQESTTGRLYIGEYKLRDRATKQSMHHLACFVPGMLALGARRMDAKDGDPDMALAKRLMETCYYEFYEKQASGLAPECLDGQDLHVCSGSGAAYILRPETVESLYYLYQLTGEPKYQEWGWQIFSSIQKNCKTRYGYSSYKDVTKVPSPSSSSSTGGDETSTSWANEYLENRMETFFAAETLKYLYLLMDPENAHVSLESHVFNTEAHPLSIPKPMGKAEAHSFSA